MVVIMHNKQENVDLQKTEINAIKIRKVHADGNIYTSYWERMKAICPVVQKVGQFFGQAGKQKKALQLVEFLKFDNFTSKA